MKIVGKTPNGEEKPKSLDKKKERKKKLKCQR